MVSLAVSVMCLMLKCMEASKVQIQINNQIWSSCLLVLVMFTVCGHFVTHFDMVAELVRTKVHKIRGIIRSLTKTTITSSSGETKKFTWSHHLKEGADVNVFGNDDRVPRVPQPTSFQGVKPSFLEWSKEVIAYLAATDNQEFTPFLAAAAASKNVIEKDVMFKGILSENTETIDKITANQVKKSRVEQKLKPRTKLKKFRISTKRSKTSWKSWKSSNQKVGTEEINSAQGGFLPQVHIASRHIRRPNCHGQENNANVRFRFRRSRWTGNLASNVKSLCGVSENADCVIPQADHVTGARLKV